MTIIYTNRSIYKSPEKIIAVPSLRSHIFHEDGYNTNVSIKLGSVQYIQKDSYTLAKMMVIENKNNFDSKSIKTSLYNLRDYALEQDSINDIAFVEVPNDMKKAIKNILGDYTVHIYQNIKFPKIPKKFHH